MSAPAWPAVKDHLVDVMPRVLAGLNAHVLDGPTAQRTSQTRYATVGYQPSAEDLSAGSFEHEQAEDGWSVRETGTVLVEFGAETGSPRVPSVAFDMLARLAEHLAADQTLDGLLDAAATVVTSAQVLQQQTQAGAALRLLVAVTYVTRRA